MDRARCPTYGGDCWVSLHLFINGTCCKDGTTIVVNRSSYLTVQPNLGAVKYQQHLATCIIFTNASSIERVGDCNFSGSLSLQAPNIVSLEILPQGRPKNDLSKLWDARRVLPYPPLKTKTRIDKSYLKKVSAPVLCLKKNAHRQG